MEFFAAILLVLRAILGSAVAAIPASILAYVGIRILPAPSSALWRFLAGFGYVSLLVFLWHYAYFFGVLSPVPVPKIPVLEPVHSPSPFFDALGPALSATLYALPYLFLFYATAFFVYDRVAGSRLLRIYLASFAFLLVMLLWVAVFPWSLERYLELFY